MIVNGKTVANFVAKILISPIWVFLPWQAMLRVKNSQKFPVVESLNLEPYLFSKNAKCNTKSSVKVTDQSSSSITTLDSMAILLNSPCGEIFWTLKVVASHFSLCSCLRLNKLFRLMFSDSRIASSFHMSKTKCEYFITYRLAPHFKELLLKDVNLFLFFVLFFLMRA